MLHRLSLWLDELSHFPYLSSDVPSAGPPRGFGKHIDQVSAHDFEIFEVVPALALLEHSCHTKLTAFCRAITYSATSTTLL